MCLALQRNCPLLKFYVRREILRGGSRGLKGGTGKQTMKYKIVVGVRYWWWWQDSREGDSECRRTGCKRLAGGPQEHPLDNPGCFLAIFISRFDTSICAICTDRELTSRAPVQSPRGTFGLLWGEGLLDRTEDPQCETHMLELHRSAGLASTWAGQAGRRCFIFTHKHIDRDWNVIHGMASGYKYGTGLWHTRLKAKMPKRWNRAPGTDNGTTAPSKEHW